MLLVLAVAVSVLGLEGPALEEAVSLVVGQQRRSRSFAPIFLADAPDVHELLLAPGNFQLRQRIRHRGTRGCADGHDASHRPIGTAQRGAHGRIGHAPAIPALVELLAANDDADVYLRHAGALALARIGEPEPVVALANHPSRGVRIAAVVALRRMRDAGVARFLADADELVVTEAARAINDDGGIDGARPQLAASLDSPHPAEAFLRRAVNANLRTGTADAARRVAAFAVRRATSDARRVGAVSVLGVWPKPSVLARVDGFSIGRAQHDSAVRHLHIAGGAELADFPSRQRAAVALRYYEDLPVAQVASALGCPEGTVKSMVSRGIRRLRRELV